MVKSEEFGRVLCFYWILHPRPRSWVHRCCGARLRKIQGNHDGFENAFKECLLTRPTSVVWSKALQRVYGELRHTVGNVRVENQRTEMSFKFYRKRIWHMIVRGLTRGGDKIETQDIMWGVVPWPHIFRRWIICRRKGSRETKVGAIGNDPADAWSQEERKVFYMRLSSCWED